ncbi:hypothetical protein LJR290_005604 [Variovorax sp. LjRoot290]|uniref:hypothetical protein n=1 Tax=Variovorax sp. LjRoot290 TaxID=3342316 RepID=UPI003ECF86DB
MNNDGRNWKEREIGKPVGMLRASLRLHQTTAINAMARDFPHAQARFQPSGEASPADFSATLKDRRRD